MASVLACRSLPPVLLVVAITVTAAVAAGSKSFTISNSCSYTVWPGILSVSGAGSTTAPALTLKSTGFELAPGESRVMAVPSGWSGRLWGRTQCSSDEGTGKFTCVTGDCGSGKQDCTGRGPAPPATIVHFTMDGTGGLDFYNVSLVDGFNVPVLVAPQGAATGGNCAPTGCAVDLNGACPADLRVESVAAAGAGVVACKSACLAFGSSQYCCTGEYGNPDTCKPSAYSEFFKNACPRAVSYTYDAAAASVFTCDAADTIYAITFCPSATRTSVKPSASSPNSQPPGKGNLPHVDGTMPYAGGSQVGAPMAASPPWVIIISLVTTVMGFVTTFWGVVKLLMKCSRQGADE